MTDHSPASMPESFDAFHARSIADPNGFWAEQAARIDWHTPFEQVLDYSRPPFARWFVGGTTNLCHNAIDRHLPGRGDQPALIFESSETGASQTWTFSQLHQEVMRMAAIMLAQGVAKGDRVLLYLPMIPEATFAMLACARIGAIHSVVFGGFASHSLANRIEDAKPRLVVSADAGSRGGKVVPYKPLLDEAIRLSAHKPERVLMVDRGLSPFEAVEGRDLDHAAERERHLDAIVPVTWLDATDPSYILYTSGTTGKPKGVQRDVGGYCVALAASIPLIFQGQPGETFFCTSDIGWVVGHSYIVYGPLIGGMATILYEGTPLRPDAGVLWSLVEKHRVSVMFSAPTAVRVLKKHDLSFITRHDTSSLRTLFLAGEPLDEPTARWIGDALRVPIVDNYWQTETGWPIMTLARGVEDTPVKLGSPGKPMYGYDVQIVDDLSGQPLGAGAKGVVAIVPPLPPGCMQTVWGDDRRFVDTYFSSVHDRLVYSTFDWGIRDEEGYWFILGRTDDVINVAGHRLGTREIEESIASHAAVAEVAVVGVADAVKGQVAVAFVVLRDASLAATSTQAARLEADMMTTVDRQLGGVARPGRVHFVAALPKTRSGKVLRRTIQAVCERRDAGDLTTIEDPATLEAIRAAVSPLLVSGIPNFRDLGGVATAAGQRLATGLLYRSSHFGNATDDDIRTLQTLGIRTVVDFRGVNERSEAAGRLTQAGIREVHLPIEPSALGSLRDRQTQGPIDAAVVGEIMVAVYQRFVRNQAPTFRKLIDLLLDEANYPLVFHCTAGKDRTGQAAALVLLALGVPTEAVLDDYLVSNQRWVPSAASADIALFSTVSPDYLHAALDAMAEHSGSVDEYLVKALGLDAETRARLAQLLLAA